MSKEPITIQESKRLIDLESKIKRGLDTFVEVGEALLEIRDSRLYRIEHATFEDYCREKWGMSRSRAHRLIEAATATENVAHGQQTEILPTTERQARPLTKLLPEEQPAAWAKAVELADGKQPTAKQVEAVVLEVMQPEAAKTAHVAHNSGENEWYTPLEFIESARAVLGTIDLDPASCEQANKTVGANKFFSEKDNGLSKKWKGNVWLNPPYAQPLISDFAEAVSAKYESGEINAACVLVNNATETKWLHRMLQSASAICLIRGRVKFIDKNGNPGAPLQGQVIIYFGHAVELFKSHMAKHGKVATL
jgi:phage N-6-adenine-methyltransferase